MEQISKIIKYEFSETEDFVDITTRLSYMNDYNYNGFCLKTNEDEKKTNKCIASLINTPVVAYYNSKTDDFEGHQVIKTKDGIKFGTHAVGTHTEAWLQNDKVTPVFSNEEVELPCIYGKARIWASRFPTYYQVLKKRLENGEMYTSWELSPITLETDDVINSEIPNPRSSDEWIFLGNCLLGSSTPAYGENSKVLEMSSSDKFDLELSEALLKDIISLSENDKIHNINDSYIQEGGNDNMAKIKVEQSALSMAALEQKLWEKINPKGWSSNPYYSVINIYPEEHKVLCRDWDKTDEELMIYTYSVSAEDEITIGEGTMTQLSKVLSERTNVNIEVKLDDTAKLLSQKETKISELESEVSTLKVENEKLNNELSTKTDALVSAGEEITTLKITISELTPFKEKIEEAERIENEKVLSAKKEDLKKFATKGGYISSDEIETSEEIKGYIENLDEKSIKALIAERVIKNLEENTNVETSSKENNKTLETASANINNEDSDDVVDGKSIMSSWLKNKK